MRDALFSFVVNATWQAALTAGLGMLLARLLRSPRQRFQLLALALVTSVAAPVSMLMLTLVPGGPAAAPVSAPASSMALPPVQTRAADIILWLYAAGLACAALRLLIAARHARRLAAASIPFRGRIRISPMIDRPVTIGRMVLLPPFVTGDRSLLAAAAAHEHAHVRRNDSLFHAALETLALPLYFHPMIRLLRRAIAEAREMACDELAAARHGRREYAEALVRLAALAARRRTSFAIGMAATSVERRVRALLRSHTAPRHDPRAVLAVLLFTAAAACTRVDVAPAVERGPLHGRWTLIGEASDFHGMRPRKYGLRGEERPRGVSHGVPEGDPLIRSMLAPLAFSMLLAAAAPAQPQDPAGRAETEEHPGPAGAALPAAHRYAKAVGAPPPMLILHGAIESKDRSGPLQVTLRSPEEATVTVTKKQECCRSGRREP